MGNCLGAPKPKGGPDEIEALREANAWLVAGLKSAGLPHVPSWETARSAATPGASSRRDKIFVNQAAIFAFLIGGPVDKLPHDPDEAVIKDASVGTAVDLDLVQINEHRCEAKILVNQAAIRSYDLYSYGLCCLRPT